jgi:hypothetical protein
VATHSRISASRSSRKLEIARLEELWLICVGRAAMLVDPSPAKTHRDQVDAETRRLVEEFSTLTRAAKDVQLSVKRLERQVAELEARRDRLDGLRAAVGAWVTSWDRAVEGFREARLRVSTGARRQVGE